MRQGLRSLVAVLAFVLALHVYMLAGLDGHDTAVPGNSSEKLMAAVGPSGFLTGHAETWYQTATTQPAGVGHDMGAACLPVLAGIVLVGAGLARSERRWKDQRRRCPIPPTIPPPSPPPIALGIART